MIGKVLHIVIMVLLALPVFSQKQPIRVGIELEAPFVIQEADGDYRGLSVDLWHAICKEKGWTYDMKLYQDQLALLRALDFGEIDITINPIPVNDTRLQLFDVSQPFMVSSVGVATTQVEKSPLRLFLRNFFSFNFLRVIGLLVLILLSFGTLLWLAERSYNRYQFRPGLKGLFDGLWWAAVTMTTVGYGDKAPKTQLGRVIAIVWMFTAVIIISGFTGSIASSLTVDSLSTDISNAEDLRAVGRIGTVLGSGGELFLRKQDLELSGLYDLPEDGLRALALHEIDVLLYDKSVLKYLVPKLRLDHRISVLPIRFNQEYRSFFMPRNNSLRFELDPVLVRQVNAVSWQETLQKYNLRQD